MIAREAGNGPSAADAPRRHRWTRRRSTGLPSSTTTRHHAWSATQLAKSASCKESRACRTKAPIAFTWAVCGRLVCWWAG